MSFGFFFLLVFIGGDQVFRREKSRYSTQFKNSGRRPSGKSDERILIRDDGRIPTGNAPETDKALSIALTVYLPLYTM